MSESDCYCEPCKAKRFEGHSLTHSAIRSYAYKPPGGWKMLSVERDPFPYHMGVELETSVNEAGEPYVDGRLAAGLRRPMAMWVPKRDGSVSGPEFASHPATLTYWQGRQGDIDEMFRLLIHAGYRSHNGGQAGMHVNVSKSAFDGPGHLHRLLTFIYANQAWAQAISQRSSAQAGRWASFRPYSPGDATAMLSEYGHSTAKYSVVHAPSGEGRLEFRLPRGTLRVDRFMKNLQWTAAMIAWTRPERTDLTSPVEFTEWASRRDLYESFGNFAREHQERIAAAIVIDRADQADRLYDCRWTA